MMMSNQNNKPATDSGTQKDSARQARNQGTADAVAQRLKEYYRSVEQEPIPGQLLDLLDRLDEAERSGGKNGAN